MVEEYVKDLYRVGWLLILTPIFVTIFQLVFCIITNIPIDVQNTALSDGWALYTSGLIIVGYISGKYRYKPWEKGVIDIPGWPIILIIFAVIVIYFLWRLLTF